MASTAPIGKQKPANDRSESAGLGVVSPKSKELVIGLVGYAGAGTSTAGDRIAVLLEAAGYAIKKVRFSELINLLDGKGVSDIADGIKQGRSKFDRACEFQDRGDDVRRIHGPFALSAAAVQTIGSLREGAEAGAEKTAFILDSLKHPDEVSLLRSVYDHTFRLVAVHCELGRRYDRLHGDETSTAKYAGVGLDEIQPFMDRDAKDRGNEHGQRVRDVFHLADFFLNNSAVSRDGAGMTGDIDRFVSLLLGNGLVRPTAGEKAIYVAFASALQSACLSRQVGSALVASDGRMVATGKNDPPKFGGGTYDEDSTPDHRCHAWEFRDGDLTFRGCHNDRKKAELHDLIVAWMAENLSKPIAKRIMSNNQSVGEAEAGSETRDALSLALATAFSEMADAISEMPGVRDAIEYSRSIHAEMAALMAAARGGIATNGASMYVTVFPCHNCARHLVAAGVKSVFYIEPYVKSLAFELHSDSISSDSEGTIAGTDQRMTIAPFTGVGPRMYDDFFVKRDELKGARGAYLPQADGEPFFAVRLRELDNVESMAVDLVPALK